MSSLKTLTFTSCEREGGYRYITSPELPGFSFMLEPGEDTNILTFLDAIGESLVAYLHLYNKYLDSSNKVE